MGDEEIVRLFTEAYEALEQNSVVTVEAQHQIKSMLDDMSNWILEDMEW